MLDLHRLCPTSGLDERLGVAENQREPSKYDLGQAQIAVAWSTSGAGASESLPFAASIAQMARTGWGQGLRVQKE